MNPCQYKMTLNQRAIACDMWRRGKNTMDIAIALNIPEHVVYNHRLHIDDAS